LASYHAVGVDGFGLGSALFKQDYTPDEIDRRAREFVKRLEDLK
jgi:2-dehydro-3-deoxyphosphogalactonate aldolase